MCGNCFNSGTTGCLRKFDFMKYTIQGKHGPKVVDLNRRKAIRERCLNCSAWSYKDVANCELKDCILYPFRSGKGKQIAKERASALRKYCLWCMNDQRFEVLNCPSVDCPLFPYRKTRMERPSKINSMLKKGHIEPVSEHKNGNESSSVQDGMAN